MHTFASFQKFGAVTPSDVTVLSFNALYIGVTGNVAILAEDGVTSVTFTNVPVGFFPVRGIKVLSTGTTASGIIWGIW